MKIGLLGLLSLVTADRWSDGRLHQGKICGDRFINVGQGSQVVKSPNYPGTFGSQVQCVWKIESAPGTRVKLMFTDFKLLLSEGCQISYVEVAEEFQNSKLCGEVPPVLVTRTNKVTITLHADMSSDIHNQRFKVQLMRTMDPPFIPRGAIKAINGQKANENVINSLTVQQSRRTPSNNGFLNPPVGQELPAKPYHKPAMTDRFGGRIQTRNDFQQDYSANSNYNQNEWIAEVEEKEISLMEKLMKNKIVIVIFLLAFVVLIAVFLCLFRKLKKVDEDEGITNVQT